MSKDPVNPNKQRNYFYTPSHTPTASLPDFSSHTLQQLLRLVSLDWNTENQIVVDNEVRALMQALGMETSRLVSVNIEEIEEDDNPDSNTVAPAATLETDESSLAPTFRA